MTTLREIMARRGNVAQYVMPMGNGGPMQAAPSTLSPLDEMRLRQQQAIAEDAERQRFRDMEQQLRDERELATLRTTADVERKRKELDELRRGPTPAVDPQQSHYAQELAQLRDEINRVREANAQAERDRMAAELASVRAELARLAAQPQVSPNDGITQVLSTLSALKANGLIPEAAPAAPVMQTVEQALSIERFRLETEESRHRRQMEAQAAAAAMRLKEREVEADEARGGMMGQGLMAFLPIAQQFILEKTGLKADEEAPSPPPQVQVREPVPVLADEDRWIRITCPHCTQEQRIQRPSPDTYPVIECGRCHARWQLPGQIVLPDGTPANSNGSNGHHPVEPEAAQDEGTYEERADYFMP